MTEEILNNYEFLTDEELTERAEESLDMAPVNYAAALDMIAVFKAYIKLQKIYMNTARKEGLFAQLEKIPEYKAFEESINEKLTLGNGYVEHFAPEKHQVEEEKDEGGRRYFHYLMSESKREENAVENLLEDKTGWFDDFIHDELMNEVSNLCRALIKKSRGL